jgi:hypothetical protein
MQARLAEALKGRRQARALVKLARKQTKRAGRVSFERGVQAERRDSKQAQREKRKGKKARKGQEGVRRRKAADRRRAAATPRATAIPHPATPHRTWQRPGYAAPSMPPQRTAWPPPPPSVPLRRP